MAGAEVRIILESSHPGVPERIDSRIRIILTYSIIELVSILDDERGILCGYGFHRSKRTIRIEAQLIEIVAIGADDEIQGSVIALALASAAR